MDATSRYGDLQPEMRDHVRLKGLAGSDSMMTAIHLITGPDAIVFSSLYGYPSACCDESCLTYPIPRPPVEKAGAYRPRLWSVAVRPDALRMVCRTALTQIPFGHLTNKPNEAFAQEATASSI
jgi:hypothetical protein